MELNGKAFSFFRGAKTAMFFIPAGILCLVMGILMMVNTPKNTVETQGTVTNIEQILGAEEAEYEITVKYTVDGKDYETVLTQTGSTNYKVGGTVKLYYDESNPGNVSTGGTTLFAIIFIVIGVIFLIVAVVGTSNAIKKNKKMKAQEAEFEAARSGQATEHFAAHAPTEKTLEEQRYYMQPDKHFTKQGFFVENSDREVVYEMLMTKNDMFLPMTFNFVNHLNGQSATHKIGHTVTVNTNSFPFSEALSVTSSFTYDGVDVWDYLHDQGIRIRSRLDVSGRVGLGYTISLLGEDIAELESAGLYLHEEDAKNAGILGKLDSTFGRYRIFTHEVDVELPFLVAFAIARTEQMAYN